VSVLIPVEGFPTKCVLWNRLKSVVGVRFPSLVVRGDPDPKNWFLFPARLMWETGTRPLVCVCGVPFAEERSERDDLRDRSGEVAVPSKAASTACPP
jgi:hypothetical protein